jgi:anti-sigma-K factor RskA
MKIPDPNLRELLAAEHVLGTHTPRVRARFARMLKHDSALRAFVEQWESRLHPLVFALPEEAPPACVWKAIQQRIARREPKGGLNFWRAMAGFTTAAVMALLLYIGIAPRSETPYMVAVMSTPEAQPMMVATWQDADKGELAIQVLAHKQMASETSWELWCLPRNKQPPVSIGLITTEGVQTVKLSKQQMRELADSEALAMSVEPKGGSPTGAPTGPVLASGPLRKI